MTPEKLAALTAQAEGGQAEQAARLALQGPDEDLDVLEAVARCANLSEADLQDFESAHAYYYQVRVPGVGMFWMAPLDAWDALGARATIVSPRGLFCLGRALLEVIGKA